MKHAFLIIAHNEYPVLEALLSLLDDARNDIYLHIDQRAAELNEKVRSLQLKHAGFHVIERPLKAYWGDISLVKVEYLLFETALARGPYAYYHLLSGVDLPVKTQDELHAFFKCRAGHEFVGFWQDEAHQRDLDRKVCRYYVFTQRLKDKGNLLHGITALSRNAFLALQKLSRYRRPRTYEFKKGSQWVSLTQAAVEYIVRYKQPVLRRMRYTLCPDEIFIQTLLWNSSFRDRCYHLEDAAIGSLRAIDWQRGHPYVWQDADLDELLQSPCIFARKFSSQTPGLICRILHACGKQAE